MVSLTIDGVSVQVPENTSVLEAARQANIKIPTLCYLKGVNAIGACRVCLCLLYTSGALAAMIASFLGASVLLQISLAVAISGGRLAAVLIFKPLDSAKNAHPPRTNSDRVIGEVGIGRERIDDVEGKGLVKVMGQTWSAVSQDGTAIEKNAEVRICAISGVKLVVERI